MVVVRQVPTANNTGSSCSERNQIRASYLLTQTTLKKKKKSIHTIISGIKYPVQVSSVPVLETLPEIQQAKISIDRGHDLRV